MQISYSRNLAEWLNGQRVSLAITTYQGNKLLLVGLQPDGRIGVFERTFPRCMGLWSDGQSIWMASQFQLWRLENVLAAGEHVEDCDRLYVPRQGFVTGDLDIHDLAIDAQGQIVFVNTLFSCLATTHDRNNFAPLWKPPFISRLAAEDRCHLNGLALQNGKPKFVTAAGTSDVADGWRDNRRQGGCLIDVDSGEQVVAELCMPHSPRLIGDRPWLLEAGSGYLGYIDLRRGHFERVTFCPGFLRGLAVVGEFAVVGLSRPRHESTFADLPLEHELVRKRAEPRCGIHVINLNTGDSPHWLRIDGIDELYDVVVLPGVRRPKAFGFKTDEIRHNVWFEDLSGQLHKWKGDSETR